jgi:hypothetical protein
VEAVLHIVLVWEVADWYVPASHATQEVPLSFCPAPQETFLTQEPFTFAKPELQEQVLLDWRVAFAPQFTKAEQLLPFQYWVQQLCLLLYTVPEQELQEPCPAEPWYVPEGHEVQLVAPVVE